MGVGGGDFLCKNKKDCTVSILYIRIKNRFPNVLR